MKRIVILFVVLLAGTAGLITAETSSFEAFRFPELPFVFERDYRESHTAAKGQKLMESNGIEKKESSAAVFNNAGFALYNRKKYDEAAELFRCAISMDPYYVYPYFNLACSLSLQYGQGRKVDLKEIYFALHKSLELEPKRVEKLDSDKDLDPIREEKGFRLLRQLYRQGSELIIDKGHQVYLKTGKEQFFIAAIAWARDMILNLEPTYTKVGQDLVFAAYTETGADLFYITAKGLGRNITRNGSIDWQLSYMGSELSLSPDKRRLAFAMTDKIYQYDFKTGSLTPLTSPRSGYMDTLPRYQDNRHLIFARGNMFEYNFAGEEHRLDTETKREEILPGGRVWEAEDLSGGM